MKMQRVERDLERRIREEYGVDGPIAPVTVCPPRTCAIDETQQKSWVELSQAKYRIEAHKRRLREVVKSPPRIDYGPQAQEEARQRKRAEAQARMKRARAHLSIANAARDERSQARRKAIKDLAAKGLYADQIAERVGVKVGTVWNYAREMEVSLTPKPRTRGAHIAKEKAAARLARAEPVLRRMHAEGASQPAMAKATGIPRTTVWKMLKKLGLTGGGNG